MLVLPARFARASNNLRYSMMYPTCIELAAELWGLGPLVSQRYWFLNALPAGALQKKPTLPQMFSHILTDLRGNVNAVRIRTQLWRQTYSQDRLPLREHLP